MGAAVAVLALALQGVRARDAPWIREGSSRRRLAGIGADLAVCAAFVALVFFC